MRPRKTMFGFVPPPIFAGWKKFPSTPFGITVQGFGTPSVLNSSFSPWVVMVMRSKRLAVQAERILRDEGAVHHHRVEFLLLPGRFDARAQAIRAEIRDRRRCAR